MYNLTVNQKTDIKSHILDSIDCEDIELKRSNEFDIVKYFMNRFESEMDWNIKQNGYIPALEYWLSGLALAIDYNYYDIAERLKRSGVDVMRLDGDYKAIVYKWFNLTARLLNEMFNRVRKGNSPIIKRSV